MDFPKIPMPYRKTYSKRYVRRRNARKMRRFKKRYNKGRYVPGTVIQKQLVIADRSFVKLKYNETTLNRTAMTIPVGGNFTINSYNGNDITQHYSGGVTSPPGFAEWASFYARYRVHAIKVKVSLVSNDATSTGASQRPLMGFIHLQSDPSPGNFTSWAAIRNLNGNRYSIFKPIAITETGGQTMPCTLARYYKFANAVGNKLQYKVDDTYEGTTGGVNGGGGPVGPARLLQYYVGIMTMDGSVVTGAPQNVSMMLTTTMYVELKDRIDLAV